MGLTGPSRWHLRLKSNRYPAFFSGKSYCRLITCETHPSLSESRQETAGLFVQNLKASPSSGRRCESRMGSVVHRTQLQSGLISFLVDGSSRRIQSSRRCRARVCPAKPGAKRCVATRRLRREWFERVQESRYPEASQRPSRKQGCYQAD